MLVKRHVGVIFEIPIWNLKADYQRIVSEIVGVINADSERDRLLVTVMGEGDSLNSTLASK